MTKGVRVDFEVPRGTPTEPCKECKRPIAFVEHPRTKNTMCLDVDSRVWDEAREHYRCEAHQAHCAPYLARQKRLAAWRKRRREEERG